jgi:hypothetical protein
MSNKNNLPQFPAVPLNNPGRRSDAHMRYTLERIFQIWKDFPSLRLMQLIGNALPEQMKDPYYVEDHTLVEKIHDFRIQYEEGYDEYKAAERSREAGRQASEEDKT